MELILLVFDHKRIDQVPSYQVKNILLAQKIWSWLLALFSS